MLTPEGKVKQAIKKKLTAEGVFYYMPVPSGYGSVGIPDILCCVPMTITQDMVGKTVGVFMGVECKAPKKEKNTTPNQRNNLSAIAEAGGTAIVASNVDTVDYAISNIKNKGITVKYVPV